MTPEERILHEEIKVRFLPVVAALKRAIYVYECSPTEDHKEAFNNLMEAVECVCELSWDVSRDIYPTEIDEDGEPDFS
jgi:hypothetical protein